MISTVQTARDVAVIVASIGIAFLVIDDLSSSRWRRPRPEQQQLPASPHGDLYTFAANHDGTPVPARYLRPATQAEHAFSHHAADPVGVFAVTMDALMIISEDPRWNEGLSGDFGQRLVYYHVACPGAPACPITGGPPETQPELLTPTPRHADQ